MFNKVLKVRSNTQVKASERRNIRAKILSCYPDITDNELSVIFPNKEPVNILKVMTHTGKDAIVYAIKKKAMFFEYEQSLYPTIYSLWNLPELLPSFTTHPNVLEKLMGGADLMIPGVVLPKGLEGPRAWGQLDKDHLVSINLTNNKAPVAIGRTNYSSIDMYMAAGRGRCINVLHVVGDELCSLLAPATLMIPELGPPRWLCQDENITELIENTQNMALDVPAENIVTSTSDIDSSEKSESPINVEPDQSDAKDPSADMDTLLRYCFLKCLKTEGNKMSMPMLISNFYRLHVLGACPQDKHLDIKKSKYKKVSKFLLEMSQEEFITIKLQSKGVESVTSIWLDHPDIKLFILDENDVCRDNADSTNSTNVAPTIVTMFSITKPTLPIFSASGIGYGECLSKADIHRCITIYIKEQSLMNQFDKKLVNMNKTLQDICGTSVETLMWHELFEKIENRLTKTFEMKSTTGTVKRKGKPQNIILSVSTRSGNKKVTLVDNLESFAIPLQEFSKLCQHGVAASTTILKAPPGKKSDQVLIQGNQVAFVGKLLIEKYQIPKTYIRGLELAIKRK